MDQFKTLQEFIVAWMDELWWSMRDRVGPLSMIECLQNSWHSAGQKVGEIAKADGFNIVKTVETGHSLLGRIVNVENNTVIVSSCPIWDKILAGQLEYALRCEEFVCAPYLRGIKEVLGAKEATVETNLRLAHVNRARLEYKIKKLQTSKSTDAKLQAQISELQQQLNQIPAKPACIFHVK
ncbi:MAG: hypothetical protein ACFFCF_04425 [Promethearchaeota archaeon]